MHKKKSAPLVEVTVDNGAGEKKVVISGLKAVDAPGGGYRIIFELVDADTDARVTAQD
jgi:hypothetical protein